MEIVEQSTASELLRPYVPRLLVEWLLDDGERRWRAVDGTLAFVDISGFTTMTERLARRGKVGAEEISDTLNTCFTELLSVAYDYGAGLVKWGGDAVLLLFDGEEHAPRAARAAAGMQRTLRAMGRLRTSAGLITLRMSVGIHSGQFYFFLAGDRHRELVITGTDATQTVAMEAIANAGEVVVSPSTAALLRPSSVGTPRGDGFLLAAEPPVGVRRAVPVPDVGSLDLALCLPEGIRDHLLADAGDAEHRPIATAFIEFRGTDALLEQHGPARVADALDELVSVVQDAVHRHEVVFSETDIAADGGKILLIAGAPRSVGDDEERMLRAARAVIEHELTLPVRIGVNCGRIFSGDFGPPYRRTYSVKGDALNTAARIMGKAELGQVLATETVLARSRTEFQTTAVGPFALKGKSEPVQAYVLGPTLGRTTASARTPLVGREQEMTALLEALESARNGEGRLIELVGEPGIGKSRLVEELTAQAGNVAVLTGACEQYESSTPYFPFHRLMRGALGIRGEESTARVVQRLRRRVDADAPELTPWLPLVGALFDVELSETPEVASLEPRFRRTRLEEVAADLLERLLPGPALLVFEDVHWMDEASADLLASIARDIRQRPWVVLPTRRDVDTGFVGAPLPGVSALRPAPLDDRQAQALIEAGTQAAPLPLHVTATLARRAGGNPLFLAELVAASRSVGVEALPDSIEALLTVQIDRLAPRDRTVLRCASVLGTTFEQDLLRASLEGDRYALDDGVWDRLGDFISRDRSGIAHFRHALVRDAAYEGLPYRRRLELHGRVGETIERLSGSSPEEHAEVLSLHFLEAQRFEKAWTYARGAGEHARSVYANVDAARLFERALQAARRLEGIEQGDLAEVWEALGDARDRAGLHAAGAAAYRAARRLRSGDPRAEASLCLKEAWMQDRLGNYPQALRWLTRGMKALEGTPGRQAAAKRAELQVFYGAIRQSQGRSAAAIGWCTKAIGEAERAGEKRVIAYACSILDWAYIAAGQPENATRSARALALYEEIGDLDGQALVLNNLGAFAYFEGRWDDALDLYRRGLDARERLGDVANGADITFNIGEILVDRGELAEAEERIRHALRVWQAAESPFGVAIATRLLGRAASRSGRYDEGLELLHEARAQFKELGATGEVVETDARIAGALVRHAVSAEGLRLATDALRTATGPTVPLAQRIRGYALIQLDRLDEARTALEASLVTARNQGAGFEEACTLDALVRLCELTADEEERAFARACNEIKSRLGIRAIPEFPLSPGTAAIPSAS